MIHVISGADFSSANIGQIDLRTAPNSITQALLNTYNKTTWTLEQKLAIEDFLTSFNSKTWKTKVKRLLLPMLAPTQSSISIAVNSAIPRVELYDLISAQNLSFFTGGAYANQLVNTQNGLKMPSFTAVSANNFITIRPNYSFVYNDFHVGVYYKKTALTTTKRIIEGADLNMFKIESDSIRIGWSGTAKVFSYDTNTLYNRGFRVASWDGTNANGLACGLPVTVSGGNGSNFVNNTDLLLFNRYSGDNNFDTELGLISLGTAMSQSEIVEYNTILDALMSKIFYS